ncbi:hypothetical protein [Legionella fallonii]|uniref:Substrate of the Dot/Icm secretion system n=1 Tax=Legionella fallonii LLAP-10 TaxID=1212491 RepID=A0A098G7Z7_9GAMM|nr:hypothetical protein [Legionella fallonii]CEG58136.1 substrate of the Dot/Icm secretion system [Legionella fallonii LLAP-10]
MVDFVLPLSQKDINACQLLIKDLKSQRPNEASAWEQPLASLVKGIELHYQHEPLIAILNSLPNTVIEALFSRLLNANNFNYSCLKTLVEYIHSLSWSDKTHQITLINILLTSRIILLNQSEIEKLLLLLEGKEQSILLAQLRRQAEPNTPKPNEKKLYPNQKKLNHIYTSNYQQLLAFLTQQASQNELMLQTRLNDPPPLANLLMGQLLEIEKNPAQQKILIYRLLKKPQCYDWSDSHFIKKIESILTAALTTVPEQEIKELFQAYLKIIQQQPNATPRSIQFLDDVYNVTKNAHIIARCLEATSESESCMAIDFLIHSKIKDQSLRQLCLRRMNIEQLGFFHKRMTILGPMGHYPDEELVTDFIRLFCTHINKLLDPQKLLKQLAVMVSTSPTYTAQLAIDVMRVHLSSPKLISQWLQTLIEVNRNNALLIPHCMLFIKEHPNEVELIVSILGRLSNEDLLALYVSMFAQGLDKNYLSCFKELFKHPKNHAQLFYLLRNTPVIHPELLDEFIAQLNDKTLVNLIGDLLTHAHPYSQYKSTINQILLIFCQRLYRDPEPTALINQWPQQAFVKKLVDVLLETPQCVAHLTTNYSTMYSLVTWTSPEDAIKHRMDAILNCYEFETERLQQIALIWLAYFRTHPEQLTAVFSTLHSTENNRTPTGRKNLSGIMQACWELIKPGIDYKEEDFFTLAQAPRPEFFNAVSTQVSQMEYLQQEPYLGSLRIAKTKELPPNINAESLIILLAHSVSPDTLINWKKATAWVKTLSVEEQLNFIKKLLENVCYANNNPILSQHAYLFVTRHVLFDELWPQLDPAHWYWLIKNTPATQLKQQAPIWLDALIERHGAQKLNLGKILSLLPPDTMLLDVILKKKTLAIPAAFAQITSQLSTENNCDVPLLALQHYIHAQDKDWRQQFLQATLSQLKTTNLNNMLLYILQALLLDEKTALIASKFANKKLIVNYLKFLNTLVKQAENSNNFAELNQLMINLISSLIEKDANWSQLVCKEEAFTQTVLRWLSNLDFKSVSINNHPLVRLLINCQSAQLDPQLANNPLFQKLLQLILFSPPQAFNPDQFIVLFTWLKPEYKILLARQLFTQPQLSAVHIQSLSVLMNVLEPTELFQLIDGHENSNHIARELLTHEKGLEHLSPIQQSQLFNYIRSASDLIAILANPLLPQANRIKFTKALFQVYGKNATVLSQRLEQWLINPEAIAALANFTIDKKDQQLLDEILQDKTYYHDYLNEYLQNPTLDMIVNEASYLSQIARNSAMNVETKKIYPAHVVEQLTLEDIFKTIKQQFYLNQEIEALSVLLSPFNAKTENPLALLLSAKWQQKLSLMHGGLLEIIRVYKDENTRESTKRAIEQTELYSAILLPLITSPQNEGLEKTLSDQLVSLLQSYCSKIAPLEQEHYQLLQNTLNGYSSQLQIMRFFSLPQLFDWFTTDIAAIPPRQENIDLLKNASVLHTEWLKRFSLEPDINFSEVLTVGLKAASLTQNNDEQNQWLVQYALFSFLSASINDAFLKNFITSITPAELSTLLNSFSEQSQASYKAQQLLQKINLHTPRAELIKQLLTLDAAVLHQLIAVTESLNLLALKNILCLIIPIKNSELNEEQIATLCLSSTLHTAHHADWLHIELQLMTQRIAHASQRLEHLTQLGFSYTPDETNEERLTYLAEKRLNHLSNETLIHCLNSYEAIFISPSNDPHPFLQSLNKILDSPRRAQEILQRLNVQLVKHIIHASINAPSRYAELLEKIIHSSHGELCLHDLQMEFNKQIKQNKDPQPTSIADLSAEQIECYSYEQLNSILSLQRLLFLSNPMAEFTSFATSAEQPETLKQRQQFCADASIYAAMLNIEKKANAPLKKSTSWLTQHSQKSIKAYAATMHEITTKQKVNYPLVQYYWLSWNSFISGTTNHNMTPVTDGFLHWLSTLDEKQLEEASELHKLLQHLIEQKILAKVLQHVVEHTQELTPSQITWLCEQSMLIAPQDSTLFPFIINLRSWGWLESYMKNSAPQNFELLTAALGNGAYIKSINENEKNQLAFLTILEINRFTPQQILALIKIVPNQQVHSLLIIHLLTQQEYLASLKGESVLSRLDNNQIYSPSRLNALVHQLDISILTEAVLDKLPTETAVSILCSIPHFHQLKEEQIDALLKKHPHPEVIIYWMNHYSSLPNAHFPLAHLMKVADTHIESALNKMDENKKEAIITKIIQHLDLFPSIPKTLMGHNEEQRLILAIRLFLHGHQHQNYVNYINKLTGSLLEKDHQFSLHAIQLLISLCNQHEFSELSNKTALLTNHYLRANAQSGEIGLFYDSNRLNIERMNQPIQLKPTITPKHEKSGGFFSNLLSGKSEEVKKPEAEVITPEHSLIETLIDSRRPITSLNYFLIYFKGDRTKISNVINDYLDFYIHEGCTGSRRKLIHQIAALMIRPELDIAIREELFTSFLRHSDLYDKQISFALFIFDATKAIQHFGLKGGEKNYTQVINLCTWALQKLDTREHQEIIDIATKAKTEAERELSFSQETGFFARVFMRLRRCWYYGWTGFFVPNPPTYVALASSEPIAPEEEPLFNSPPMLSILSYKPELNITSLLKELTLPMTQESLEQLAEAINNYSLKPKTRNELEIRQKLHLLLLKFHEHSAEDKALHSWLEQNQTLVIANLSRLLELTLIKDQHAELQDLLKQIKEIAPSLQQITEELICPPLEQKEEKTAVVTVQSEAEVSHLTTLEATLESTIETTTELAYNAYSWAKEGLSSLFQPLTSSATTESLEPSLTMH